MIEGANINRSLLSLGNCINALCNPDKSKKHIPYWDSKLTWLLKDSLGGNCWTVMIANISPSFMCYEDSLNTLKYADWAKHIKTTCMKNIVNVDDKIKTYKTLIGSLRSEIESLQVDLKPKVPISFSP